MFARAELVNIHLTGLFLACRYLLDNEKLYNRFRVFLYSTWILLVSILVTLSNQRDEFVVSANESAAGTWTPHEHDQLSRIECL